MTSTHLSSKNMPSLGQSHVWSELPDFASLDEKYFQSTSSIKHVRVDSFSKVGFGVRFLA